MKRSLFLFCIIVVVSFTKYFVSHKSEKSVLFLYNIEALASADEYPVVSHCYGTGTLDCPASHRKVEYIAGGYSLEDLY